jgi:hypothetical protein
MMITPETTTFTSLLFFALFFNSSQSHKKTMAGHGFFMRLNFYNSISNFNPLQENYLDH